MPSSSDPRSKGTNFIPAVKFLRVHRQEAEAKLSPSLRKYLEERILPGSWYSETELMALLRIVVDILPGDERRSWEIIGEEAAEAHAAGPYERLIRQGPRGLLGSFGPVWGLTHDTGRWEIELEDDHRADMRLFDFPTGMPEYGDVMTGYFRRILPLGGAVRGSARLVDRDATSGAWIVSWED